MFLEKITFNFSNKKMSKNDTQQDDLDSSINKKELRKKILDQLEFYFSDSNLTKDRFLKQEIKNSTDGCRFMCRNNFLNLN